MVKVKLIVAERGALISSFFFSFRERRIHAFYTAIYLTIYAILISFPLFSRAVLFEACLPNYRAPARHPIFHHRYQL
jgi:hypothetical protein